MKFFAAKGDDFDTHRRLNPQISGKLLAIRDWPLAVIFV
jgi:hypothetical protein